MSYTTCSIDCAFLRRFRFQKDLQCAGRKRCNERRELMAAIFLCSIGHVHAMEQQQAMLERVVALAEAATRSAVAAETATTQTVQTAATVAKTSSSVVSNGLQAAAKVLKNPDAYSGEDATGFASWRFQFMSWLTYGDSRFIQILEAVEARDSMPTMANYNEGEKEMAHKLYAVLTSYLRGRCAHLAKAHSKTRGGLAVWYSLMREFEPSSRQRNLALAQALASFPTFPKDRSCMDSILIFEETIQRFEGSSNTKCPDELKTLLRCSPAKLKGHLQLTLDDKAIYHQVREQILNFERVSKNWGHETVLKSIHDANKGVADGPTPMEVDRVEGKSKGKGKKGKGKGGWNIPWGAGRGFGGRSGGKAKGKCKKGRGRARKERAKMVRKEKAASHNQCKICFGYGHWSGGCPQRMDVNNVQQDTSYTGSPVNNNGASSSSVYRQAQGEQSPVQPRTGTVRKIFHISPSSSYPASPASPASSRHVRMVEFLDSSDEDMHVRKVTGEEWIILDSGSGLSLLPARFSVDGNTTAGTSLRNCQGGKLKTRGTRHTDLQVRDVEGEEVLLHHEFIVGDATTGLVSLGQLYQAGWKIDGEGSGELFLIDPRHKIKSKCLCTSRTSRLQSERLCVMWKNEKMMVTQMFLLFMCVPMNPWMFENTH